MGHYSIAWWSDPGEYTETQNCLCRVHCNGFQERHCIRKAPGWIFPDHMCRCSGRVGQMKPQHFGWQYFTDAYTLVNLILCKWSMLQHVPGYGNIGAGLQPPRRGCNPFFSLFSGVLFSANLHESTRSMYDKSWSQEVANSPLSREEGSLASRRWRRRRREKVLKEVTDREQSDGRFALHGVLK